MRRQLNLLKCLPGAQQTNCLLNNIHMQPPLNQLIRRSWKSKSFGVQKEEGMKDWAEYVPALPTVNGDKISQFGTTLQAKDESGWILYVGWEKGPPGMVMGMRRLGIPADVPPYEWDGLESTFFFGYHVDHVFSLATRTFMSSESSE